MVLNAKSHKNLMLFFLLKSSTFSHRKRVRHLLHGVWVNASNQTIYIEPFKRINVDLWVVLINITSKTPYNKARITLITKINDFLVQNNLQLILRFHSLRFTGSKRDQNWESIIYFIFYFLRPNNLQTVSGNNRSIRFA